MMENGEHSKNPESPLQLHRSSSYVLALKSLFVPKDSISKKQWIKCECGEANTQLSCEDKSDLPSKDSIRHEIEIKKNIKPESTPPFFGKTRSLPQIIEDIPTHTSKTSTHKATQSSGSLPQHMSSFKEVPVRVNPSEGVAQHVNIFRTSPEHHVVRNRSQQTDTSAKAHQLINGSEDPTKHQNIINVLPGDYGDTLPSNSSIVSDEVCCRICQEDDTGEKLVSPCFCSGTVGSVHMSCLETWLKLTCRTNCELCLHPFPVEKIHPSAWQHVKNPTENMDFSSFLCDVACFFVLTPLLAASTYLCSIGAAHYDEAGKTESTFAIVTLMCSLVAVYISWGILAVLYHYRVWLTWREAKAEIRMWRDSDPLVAVTKQIPNSKELNTTEHGRFDDNLRSGTSILLKPILRYSGSIKPKSRNSVANINTCVNNVPALCVVESHETMEIFRASNDRKQPVSPSSPNVPTLKIPSESTV